MKVEINLDDKLTPEELASFCAKAQAAGRTADDHASVLLFGDRELKTPKPLTGRPNSNRATVKEDA